MYFHRKMNRLPGSDRKPRRFAARPLLAAALALVALLAGGLAQAQDPSSATPVPAPLDTSDHKAVFDRAELYMVRKFYPEAVDLYQRLTELDPKNAIYQNKLGIAYHSMQDLTAAKRAYRVALQLNPMYPEATNNLAAVEYAQKSYRNAILTYLKALELNPLDAVIYSNLGTAYFAYDRVDYAMDAYRYALRLNPAIFETTGRVGNIVHNRDVKDVAAFNFYLAKPYASPVDVENTLLYISKAWESGFPDLRKNLDDKVFLFLAAEPRFLELLAQLDSPPNP